MSPVTRRQVLAGAGVGAAALATATAARWGAGGVPARVPATAGESPFALGIASGDPLADAVILWTRLAADAAGSPPPGVPDEPAEAGVVVSWEVAADEAFAEVVAHGTVTTQAQEAHSVHVDVRGLAPDTRYHYRFRALGATSPAGRTRTLPAEGADVAAFRFAVSSCQRLSDGYYPAYRQLVDDDVAVLLWLGDYIYEDAADSGGVRPEPRLPSGGTKARTLDDFRALYAGYRSDPDLRMAHAAVPWIATWDDHEVADNYGGTYPGPGLDGRINTTEFLRMRAAAYQAWWEHMPVRPRFDVAAARRDPGTEYRIYRSFDVGSLLRICVLDERQYRSGLAAEGAAAGLPARGEENVAGTMTGPEQESWLLERTASSNATWTVVAHQVMLSPTRFGPIVNLDEWDGFVPQRRRLLATMAEQGVRNLVVLAGDIHTTWANVLSPRYASVTEAGEAVAAGADGMLGVELVAPPMSSAPPTGFVPAARVSNAVGNPAVRYFDGDGRGYLRCDVSAREWRAVPVVCDEPNVAGAALRLGPTLVVAAGAAEVAVVGP